MFLVDTNVLSALRRRDRAEPAVVAWASGIDAADMFVSVVTILELELGALSKRRQDHAQGQMLIDWIEGQVLPTLDERILPVDLAVARRAAALHVPDRRPERHALIGATALIHGLTVATRNVGNFRPMNVPAVNPWEYAQPLCVARPICIAICTTMA